LPSGLKDWLIDFWNKIYFFISSIWNWFTNYLSYILSKILDLLKGNTTPNVPDDLPDRYKFKDIHNKEYVDNLIQTLDEYKFYILITIGVIALGILTYTYWGSITPTSKGGGNEEGFDITPSPIPSEPSTGKSIGDYPAKAGYLNYFSKKIGDMVERVTSRAKDLFTKSNNSDTSGITSNITYPSGLYTEGHQTMWQGLPVPRVENINGTEYYISLDKDRFINILDNTRGNNIMDIIDPLTNVSIGPCLSRESFTN